MSETDAIAAASKEGLLALETIPTQRFRYNYVCDPTQMPLDVIEAITAFSYGGGVGEKASEPCPPHPVSWVP